MNTEQLLEQLEQQTEINNVLLLTLSGLQDDIIKAQQSAAVNTDNSLAHLHTAWNRIKLALVERDRILNDKDDSDRDLTTDKRQAA